MDAVLRIQKEFRINFLKVHFQQLTSVAFQQIEIKAFGLKWLFEFSEDS